MALTLFRFLLVGLSKHVAPNVFNREGASNLTTSVSAHPIGDNPQMIFGKH